MDALLGAFGAIFASGLGILFLATLAAAIVILWDWRVALIGVVLLNFGMVAILVHLHSIPGLLAGGQLLAVFLGAAILGGAKIARSSTSPLRHASNMPLRLLALLFVLGAWWFLDPGYALPLFSQAETDFLLWMVVCGLAMAGFTTSPFFAGVALLLWSMPIYAVAGVLLPGSGLPVIIGIVDLMLALACGYLVLAERISHVDIMRRLPLPVANPATTPGAAVSLPQTTEPGTAAQAGGKSGSRSNPLLKRSA